MTFDAWFKASSYATVACGAAALAAGGGVGEGLGAAFAAVLALAWFLEGKRWQLPERAGLAVVLLSLPLFYLDWRYHESAVGASHVNAGVVALVHLTLFLSSVKLLQVKSDRDWLFLYLISFFEVLLAAGLSVSPLFLAALGVYLFCALLTALCFELRKARASAPSDGTRARVTYDPPRRRLLRRDDGREKGLRRLPAAALFLLVLIFTFALPIFYITPRFGNRSVSLAANGATGYTGFSDVVSLGDIGRLQKSDRLVMRVRVEGEQASRVESLRWRGLSLDNFDGRTWRRSSNESQIQTGGDRDFFQFGTTHDLNRLTIQTFFIEPVDTPVLFAAPRVVALQGALAFVRSYGDGGALTSRPHPKERINYRVYSDTVAPEPDVLRSDRRRYPRERTPNLQAPIENYLRYPADTDTRTISLAWLVLNEAGARNRYDAARAVEAHLGRNEHGGEYGYSLEMRAAGGDPLADFLFNVRAGHCEYFATAMAMMLRTQGIAARVVNGFQAGEYNSSADAYVVRQYDAHSWVEVYFPETDAWVAFDPTPAEGRPGAGGTSGLRARMRKYAEAFELFWIQYVVAYDRQEQRSLANSLRNSFEEFRRSIAQAADGVGTGLSAWRGGDDGGDTPADGRAGVWLLYARRLLIVSVACVLLLVAARGVLKFRGRKKRKGGAENRAPAVEFYERMSKALEGRGLRRAEDQTPLEFAAATGVPETLTITNAYHRVRYGARNLSPAEVAEVERCLRRVEEINTVTNVK